MTIIEISIIVPVFNTPQKLFENCLNSLHIQKNEKAEFLIIDDGSTYEWIKTIINNYCELDTRFKYIKKRNTGVSDTRNLGIKLSKGKYIMFVDSDDQLLPDACNYAVNVIKKTNSDVVLMAKETKNKDKVSFCKMLDEDERQNLMYSVLAFSSIYANYNIIVDSPWAKIFKSSIIQKNSISFPSELLRSEDAMFCLYYYESCKNIFVDNHIIYKYITNSDSICRKMSKVSVIMLPLILQLEEKFIKKSDYYTQSFKTALTERTLKGINECFSSYFFHPSNNKKAWTLAKELKNLIENPIVNKYYTRINISDLLGKRQKLYHHFLKRKMYWGIFIINKVLHLFFK